MTVPLLTLAAAALLATGIAGCDGDAGLQPPQVALDALDATARALIERHRAAVLAEPRSGTAWGRLGLALRHLGFAGEALACFTAAERFDATAARWPYLQGLLVAASSPPSAAARLERAAELCGDEPATPRLRLAELLVEQGAIEEAAGQLERLLRKRPGFSPALLALARIEQARGRFAEAEALAVKSVEDAATGRKAWTLLAALAQRRGDAAAAAEATRRARLAPPAEPLDDRLEWDADVFRGDARVLSARAHDLLLRGRPGNAAPLIELLVSLHSKEPQTWYLLGRLRVLQQDWRGAEEALRRHLELDPQSTYGTFQLGLALLAQGRLADAGPQFEEALRRKPDFGPAAFNLGLVHGQSGRLQDAIAAFRQCLRHNPEHLDAYLLLADAHRRLGETSEALEMCRQAEQIQPDDPRLDALRAELGSR